MADRSIRVTLRAEIAGYRVAMNEAATATRRVAEEGRRATTAMGQMTQSAQNNRQAWDQGGRALTMFGALAVGGLALSVKAAIDWETAWTGVLKTVDGTPAQLAKVEDGLRSLARQLPISHAELAGVAEAAGQLGIATDDVVGFTKIMVDLGQTTNLSAEEAATSLARISNIMGTSADDVSRMGATIVDLGNNSATTEREILELGTRLAASGKQAGLSEADIFAFASALTSVGVEAEAGGTAMSKVFTSIADATRDGGDNLNTFARVSGLSATEFKRAFEQDAGAGITMFIEGMGRMANAGESTTDVFKDLGLNDARLKRAILSTGAASGLVGEQIALANKAWEANTALLEEAEKRYGTTASKIESAKGSIYDAAITMGETFLPAIAAVADGVSKAVDAFGSIPGPIQAAIGVTTALIGGTALLAGGFLLLLPRIIETRIAFRILARDMPRVASAAQGVGGALKGVGLAAAGVAATAVAVGLLVGALVGGDAVPKAEALRKSIRGVVISGDGIGDLGGQFNNFGKILGVNIGKVDDLSGAFDMLLKPSTTDQVTRAFTWLPGPNYMETLQKRVEGLDQALSGMVAEGDVENVQAFQASLMDMGYSAEDINKLLPNTVDGLLGVAEAEKEAAAGADGFAAGVGGAAVMTEEATEALEAWMKVINDANAKFVNSGSAYDAVIAKTQEWAQAQADATETADDSWEDYYDGQTVSVDSWIEQLTKQNEALANWQANIFAITAEIRTQMPADMVAATDAMIDELVAMGPEGAAALQTFRDANADERIRIVEAWQGTGLEITDNMGAELYAARNPTVVIDADDTSARTTATDLQNELNNRGLAVPPWEIDADTAPAVGSAAWLQGQLNGTGSTLPDWAIDANTAPATATTNDWLGVTSAKTATVKVDANTAAATLVTESWMNLFGSKTIKVGVTAGPTGSSQGAYATGGEITGPGTGTSDSVPILASNGEHMITAAEVQAAGGHAAIYDIRAALRARRKFATGGEITAGSSARSFSNINPQPMRSSSQSITVAAPSLEGMVLTGTLMVNGLPAEMRAVAVSVVQEDKRSRSGFRGQIS